MLGSGAWGLGVRVRRRFVWWCCVVVLLARGVGGLVGCRISCAEYNESLSVLADVGCWGALFRCLQNVPVITETNSGEAMKGQCPQSILVGRIAQRRYVSLRVHGIAKSCWTECNTFKSSRRRIVSRTARGRQLKSLRARRISYRRMAGIVSLTSVREPKLKSYSSLPGRSRSRSYVQQYATRHVHQSLLDWGRLV